MSECSYFADGVLEIKIKSESSLPRFFGVNFSLMASPSTLAHSLGHNTLGKTDIAVQSVLLGIVFVFVGLRLWSRRFQSLQLNDLLIIVATVRLSISLLILSDWHHGSPQYLHKADHKHIVLDGRSLCGGNHDGRAVWNGTAFHRGSPGPRV